MKGTIGAGGQACVKEAIDNEMQEAVALKIYKKRKMSLLKLNGAYNEYQLMKQIQHANIL